MMLWRSWCWRLAAAVLVWLAVAAAAAAQGSGPAADGLVTQLERSLLASFGLQQRPTARRRLQAPPYMMAMYRTRQWSGPEPFTVRSFYHKKTDSDHLYPTHKMRYRFNLNAVPAQEQLKSAEIRLNYAKHPAAVVRDEGGGDGDGGTSAVMHRVLVYDVVRLATRAAAPALRMLDTAVVNGSRHGVFSLDVSEAVRRWISQPATNHGLLVEVIPYNKSAADTSHVRLRRDLSRDDDDWTREQPMLVLHTEDEHDVVMKRTKRTPKYRKTRESCRRHRLFVDFKKVGWDDWIVAPRGYEAYFCRGDCPLPLPDNINATNHAVVQTLVNSRYPDRVPKACCVPTELSPISMLYMDDDEMFVLKNHQDMVVEGCGCR